MHDYMKALYHRFEAPSKKAEYLDRKIKRTHSQLAQLLNKPERKLLLQIADMEDELRDESCLNTAKGYPIRQYAAATVPCAPHWQRRWKKNSSSETPRTAADFPPPSPERCRYSLRRKCSVS